MTSTPILPAHIEDTLRAIAKLHADHYQDAGKVQRCVERVTASISRPMFIAMMTWMLGLWVAANLALSCFGWQAWDEPPFVWLQAMVGLLALYVTLLVLSTQRRADELATYREQLTLELAILSEQKTAKVIGLLEEIRRDCSGLNNRDDQEAASMANAADPQTVLNALKDNQHDVTDA